MKTVTLQVDDEVSALVDLVAVEVADIKAKKGAAAEIADAIPSLLALASGYQKLGADVKSPDDIAYLVQGIAKILLPAPAAATP